MEDQTQSNGDPPFDGNTTQHMETRQYTLDAQPNQNSGETILHILAQSPSPNPNSPSFMEANQPTLNTSDQNSTQSHTDPETNQPNLSHVTSTLAPSNRTLNIRFSQPQTLSSSSSEYQTPNPNSPLPTRKRFRKEFGKLKRNLRQRLLCGLFNRETKGGSETEGSNFLVLKDDFENENHEDMVLEGLWEAVPQQLPHQS